MTLPRRWSSPKLTDEEIREIESRRRLLKKELSGLNIKPTKSGEVAFRPLEPGQPSPPTGLDVWLEKRKRYRPKNGDRDD